MYKVGETNNILKHEHVINWIDGFKTVFEF